MFRLAKERKNARTLVARPEGIGNMVFIDPRKSQSRRKTPSGNHSQRRSAHRRKPGFSPERQSGYSVTRKSGTLAASRIHGRIVNELAREISGMGIEVNNTGLGGEIRPDLVVLEPSTVIEVKAEGAWTDIIHGIGQCYVYGDLLGGHTQTSKILVVPASTGPEKIEVLSRLGISAVKWREKNGEISFTRLKRALPKRVSGGH